MVDSIKGTKLNKNLIYYLLVLVITWTDICCGEELMKLLLLKAKLAVKKSHLHVCPNIALGRMAKNVVVTRPLPRNGGMAEDHGALEATLQGLNQRS